MLSSLYAFNFLEQKLWLQNKNTTDLISADKVQHRVCLLWQTRYVVVMSYRFFTYWEEYDMIRKNGCLWLTVIRKLSQSANLYATYELSILLACSFLMSKNVITFHNIPS